MANGLSVMVNRCLFISLNAAALTIRLYTTLFSELYALVCPFRIRTTRGLGWGTALPSTLNSIKYNYLPSISFTLSTIVCSPEPSVVAVTRDAPRHYFQTLCYLSPIPRRIRPLFRVVV